MAVVLSMAKCPNCGAPHDPDPQRNSVICIYCSTTLRVERAAAAPVTLRAQSVPKEDIERVTQLLVDGKREEAIAHYMRVASLSRDDAEQAIASLVISSYFELTKRLPLNGFGFFLYGVRVSVFLGVAGWAATRAVDSAAWFALVAIALVFAVLQLVSFVPHLRSTLVSSFGAVGRGRVQRRAVLRGDEKKDEYLVAVMFEVAPDDGGPTFVDQETLFVGGATLQKLTPGNVLQVRFDGARELVFLQSPVIVQGSDAVPSATGRRR